MKRIEIQGIAKKLFKYIPANKNTGIPQGW